jgi:hypothetical protein
MKNQKTITIVVAVILLIAAFVALSRFQSSTAKTEIGWGGAFDTCNNKSLQAEFENMGYKVTCYGQNMGSSDLVKLPGDPNYKIDLLVTSSPDTTTKLRDLYGQEKKVGDYATFFSSPLTPLVQTKDAHILIDAGLVEKYENYLRWTNDTQKKIYECQSSVTNCTWGDLGVTDPTWKNATAIISATNPFSSGTGYSAFLYSESCMLKSPACSTPLFKEDVNDQVKEQMRRVYVSYGAQSEDGDTIKYMVQWMNRNNKVLVIMGNESFPMVFASKIGDPSKVEDMQPIYSTYSIMSSQYFSPASIEGEKFVQDVLNDPKIAEIVNKELGSRMGYENSLLPTSAASWVPATEVMTYVQPPKSNLKAPILCYIGEKEQVSAKLMWTSTFGKKPSKDGQTAEDGRSFEEAVAAYCAENQ